MKTQTRLESLSGWCGRNRSNKPKRQTWLRQRRLQSNVCMTRRLLGMAPLPAPHHPQWYSKEYGIPNSHTTIWECEHVASYARHIRRRNLLRGINLSTCRSRNLESPEVLCRCPAAWRLWAGNLPSRDRVCPCDIRVVNSKILWWLPGSGTRIAGHGSGYLWGAMCRLVHGWTGRQEVENGGQTRIYQGIRVTDRCDGESWPRGVRSVCHPCQCRCDLAS